MNWTEMKSDWETISPMLVTWWTKLDEGDLRRIDGSREKLAEVLGERYGLSDEEVEGHICAFEKEVRRPGAAK